MMLHQILDQRPLLLAPRHHVQWQRRGRERQLLQVHQADGKTVMIQFADSGPGMIEPDRVFDPGPVTGSEDVGILATAAGAPCVYWLLGGADPRHFAGASTRAEIVAATRDVPSNHSPLYAPVLQPTLAAGVAALTTAVLTWLGSS